MSDTKEPILVELPGHGEFYVDPEVLEDGGDGPIPCFEHATGWDSYAHVYADGAIRRYFAEIGRRGDLRRVAAQ